METPLPCFLLLEAGEMEDLPAFLKLSSPGGFLPWSEELEAVRRFGVTPAEVEGAALALGIMPERYRRNMATISTDQQGQLLKSTVAVIGCGGLGGYLIEELARVGVGAIRAVDPDVFEEHNLNRQILATIPFLGRPKVEAAKARVADINPATEVIPLNVALTADNGRELLSGVDVAADALDSVDSRLILSALCAEMGISLVHGSIAGWYGQVLTQPKGEYTLERIFERARGAKGIEVELGNPAFTPAVIASLQVAEVVKVLLGEGTPLTGRMLFIDLLTMKIDEVWL
jgi:molybdopterin-synthase adenylyltransferase